MKSNSKTAITATQIQEIARTGKPFQLPDRRLITVDYVVGCTSRKDWDGTLYQLKPSAAYEIADSINQVSG